MLPTVKEVRYCGAAFCTLTDEQKENQPPRSEVNIITAIYLSCVVVAVIIATIFLDPLTRYGEGFERNNEENLASISKLVLATLEQLKKPNQQLLIFITIFVGMEQAFISTEFTKAFITCELGVGLIGFILISFGIFDCTSAIIFGSLVEYIGRFPIICLGILGHVSLIAWALVWETNSDQLYLFFIYASCWGIIDGIWQAQINGLYGSLFKTNKEAAFSNYRLFEAMGFAISLGNSTFFCLRTKLLILLTVLLIGSLGYGVVELMQYRKVSNFP